MIRQSVGVLWTCQDDGFTVTISPLAAHATHCISICHFPWSCIVWNHAIFFFLLVLSDADNSGGEKSRSKIMLSDSLVWVNYRCQETRACAGCVCVCVCVCVRYTETETKRGRKRERMGSWERVKGDGSKIIMKAFKSWGKVFVGLFRKLMKHTNLPVLPLQRLLAPTEGRKLEAFICSP